MFPHDFDSYLLSIDMVGKLPLLERLDCVETCRNVVLVSDPETDNEHIATEFCL
jgi:hypothetical protein